MQLVADRGPQTVPELARACALGRQNLQRVVDRLLERGLVERIANPAHRRSARFGLSPPGVATVHALRQREEEAVRGIAMGLAQADIDACRRVLDHLESGLRLSGRSPTGSPAPGRM